MGVDPLTARHGMGGDERCVTVKGLPWAVDAKTMNDADPGGGHPAERRQTGWLPRLSASAFTDLAVWMVGLGVVTGLCFPFFVLALGVPRERALTVGFFAATVAAGLLVSGLNFLLARGVVGRRLRILNRRIHSVREEIAAGGVPERRQIAVDSTDEFGVSAAVFNELLDALVQARRVEAAFRDFSEAFTSQLDVTALADESLGCLLQHTGGTGGAIFGEINGELLELTSRGDASTSQSTRHAAATEAILSGRSSRSPSSHGAGSRSVTAAAELLVTPFKMAQGSGGAVAIELSSSASPHAALLLDLFCRGLDMALGNALTHRQVRELSLKDSLTGLLNHGAFQERLRSELGRARREGYPVALVALDVDLFKEINDGFGHAVGDQALRQLATALETHVRIGDVTGRIGGDEFMIALPGSDAATADALVARLQSELARVPVTGAQGSLTVSAGIASFPHDAIDQDELMRRADAAMYRSKHVARALRQATATPALAPRSAIGARGPVDGPPSRLADDL